MGPPHFGDGSKNENGMTRFFLGTAPKETTLDGPQFVLLDSSRNQPKGNHPGWGLSRDSERNTPAEGKGDFCLQVFVLPVVLAAAAVVGLVKLIVGFIIVALEGTTWMGKKSLFIGDV